MSPHDSLAVHPDPSERSPTLPSSSGLCRRSTDWKWTAVNRRRGITAAEGHGACTSTGWPRQRWSLPDSDSWLSKKKQKKIRSLFLHVLVQSSYILDVVVGTSSSWMLGSSRAFDFVWLWLCHLCDLLTIHVGPVRDKPATWLVTVM